MRKLVLPVVLLLGIVYVFINIAEVEAVADTLQRGEWHFILLAFGLQALWMLNATACYRSIYRALNLDERFGRLFLLIAAANFVNVVAPSGGMGGVAIFVSEARRRNYSSARVTVASAVVILLDYLAFLCVLSLGLIVLLRRHNLTATELGASAVLLLVAIVLAALIYLGMHSADALERALTWMARQVNRILLPFIHRSYLSEERAHSFAYEAASGLYQLRRSPMNLLLPFMLSLNGKVLLVLILFLVFVAFGVPYSIGTLVGGFSIGYLFYIVSPTPAGIGFVEGALTLGLHSLNVPLGAATVLTLAYRGITFWVPLCLGVLAFRRLSRQEKAEVSM